jgi:hypothetical protein
MSTRPTGRRNGVKVRILKRFTLNGTIDPHDPVGVTLKVTGGDKPFRVTFITVNWGRGYDPGEFKRNVLNVLNRVRDEEHVILLVQELDEDDKAEERVVFKRMLEPKTKLVGFDTHEPIAVSPGAKVTRQRRRMTMDQGTKIGAPAGTGPRRYLVTCVVEIHGVKIGVGNQHPHRNMDHPRVQDARQNGKRVTREVMRELAPLCDFVVHGGDMNDADYPPAHAWERTLHERGYDTLRLIA